MSVENVKEWVVKYADELYAWACYKTNDKAYSEDLVQETFIAAFKNYASFERQSSPKTWLFAILNNKIIDFHRKNVKKIVFQTLPDKGDFFSEYFKEDGHWNEHTKPHHWDTSETELFDDDEFVIVWQSCLQKLPPTWNSAITLKFLNEGAAKEICQELAITPSNFWQIVHRTKVQLRECLDKNWFKRK